MKVAVISYDKDEISKDEVDGMVPEDFNQMALKSTSGKH